ncbi:hypothetical protein KBC70_00655 [Candidatus Woesebacteria bacterium]|jgi:hypothetical protein|nr:hypothetical protein [Candidatus Woesebacteria bacterium]
MIRPNAKQIIRVKGTRFIGNPLRLTDEIRIEGLDPSQLFVIAGPDGIGSRCAMDAGHMHASVLGELTTFGKMIGDDDSLVICVHLSEDNAVDRIMIVLGDRAELIDCPDWAMTNIHEMFERLTVDEQADCLERDIPSRASHDISPEVADLLATFLLLGRATAVTPKAGPSLRRGPYDPFDPFRFEN